MNDPRRPESYAAIARLVWPLALGMLNNAVLQFVDRVFLAHESMASLEAALPAAMLASIVMCFFQSVVAYSGTFVAQYFGAGDRLGMEQSYRAGVRIALVSGLLCAALVPTGLKLMPLLLSSAEVCARARTYYAIVSCGALALCGQMAASSYFTGQGRTRFVFWVNLGGNLLNIALDPLLIFVCRLGIAGAAYATVFAMFCQWLVLAGVARRERLKTSTPPGSPWPLVVKILRFGVPSGAYSVLNLLSFTVFLFVTGWVGDLDFAVSNACFSVNWLLIAPMEGFAIGASVLVAQAQGRGDSLSARVALRRTLLLALSLVALLSLGAVAAHRPILELFVSPGVPGATFHALGFKLVVLMAVWQVFDAADVVISGALKGAGDTAFVMWWMVFVAFGVWLPLVGVVRLVANTMPALWCTMVVYVVVIAAGSALRWRRGRWARHKLV